MLGLRMVCKSGHSPFVCFVLFVLNVLNYNREEMRRIFYSLFQWISMHFPISKLLKPRNPCPESTICNSHNVQDTKALLQYKSEWRKKTSISSTSILNAIWSQVNYEMSQVNWKICNLSTKFFFFLLERMQGNCLYAFVGSLNIQ